MMAASPILSCEHILRKQHLPPCAGISFHVGRKRPSLSLYCSSRPSSESEWAAPDKKKPLYSHSLPCIESWLKTLHFYQSKDDRSIWFVQHPNWHAQLSLDLTDLCIRYLKSGPGTLEKDVERRFKYALSREDIEKAILGGP